MAGRVTATYTSGFGFVQKFTDLVRQESLRAVNESSLVMREVMIQKSPFGGTNLLRASWQSRPARVTAGGRVHGEVVAKGSVSANVIDGGAKPHFPPVGAVGSEPALGVWIRRILGQADPKQIRSTAFAISRKFKRVGIPAKRTFSIAFTANTDKIVGIMMNMMLKIGQGF